jgi:hypothetical protein
MRRRGGEHPPGSGSRPQPHPPPAAYCSTSAFHGTHSALRRSGIGGWTRSPSAGLAAQPFLVDRVRGRGQTRLHLGRAAGQHQRCHPRAGHDLAVAAQGCPRPGPWTPVRNPAAVRQRAAVAARQHSGRLGPPGALDRCLWPSIPAPFPSESGHRLSCMSGCAAMRGTPSWAPTWSLNLNSELRTEAHEPDLGDHRAGRPCPPAGRPARPPCRAPPGRPHQSATSTSGAGHGGRCPLIPLIPDQLGGEARHAATRWPS